jgi:hypothetical protein
MAAYEQHCTNLQEAMAKAKELEAKLKERSLGYLRGPQCAPAAGPSVL